MHFLDHRRFDLQLALAAYSLSGIMHQHQNAIDLRQTFRRHRSRPRQPPANSAAHPIQSAPRRPQRERRPHPNPPVLALMTSLYAAVCLHRLADHLLVLGLQIRNLRPLHVRHKTNRAKQVHGDTVHVPNAQILINQVDTVQTAESSRDAGRFNLTAYRHPLQPAHRLAERPPAAPVPFVLNHACFNKQSRNRLIDRIVYCIHLLDDRGAAAGAFRGNFLLCPSVSAVLHQCSVNCWLGIQRVSAPCHVFPINRGKRFGRRVPGNQDLPNRAALPCGCADYLYIG